MDKHPAVEDDQNSDQVEPAEDWEEIGGNPVCYLDSLGLCPTCESSPCVCSERFKMGKEAQGDPD